MTGENILNLLNEEKLLKLLQTAVENGWCEKLKWIKDAEDFYFSSYRNKCYVTHNNNYYEVTVDNLVVNFEEDSVSFIEALCSADLISAVKLTYNFEIIAPSNFTDTLNYQWKCSAATSLRLMYILQPTAKRIDWLLNTFKHLLKKKT